MRYILAIVLAVTVALPIGDAVHASLNDSAAQISNALNPEGTP